jgi:hypothetical protein
MKCGRSFVRFRDSDSSMFRIRREKKATLGFLSFSGNVESERDQTPKIRVLLQTAWTRPLTMLM